jgi:hypothetical protein
VPSRPYFSFIIGFPVFVVILLILLGKECAEVKNAWSYTFTPPYVSMTRKDKKS